MSTVGFANPVMCAGAQDCARSHDLEEQIFTFSKVFGEANTSFNTGRSASSPCSTLHGFIAVLLIHYATPVIDAVNISSCAVVELHQKVLVHQSRYSLLLDVCRLVSSLIRRLNPIAYTFA